MFDGKYYEQLISLYWFNIDADLGQIQFFALIGDKVDADFISKS